MFSKDGSFISSVGNIGRGPGEYMYAVDFDVDAIEKRVAIYDGRKLHFYNYHGTRVSHVYGDVFAGYIEAHRITRSRENWRKNPHLLAEIPDNIRDFADEINENDNPVLVYPPKGDQH